MGRAGWLALADTVRARWRARGELILRRASSSAGEGSGSPAGEGSPDGESKFSGIAAMVAARARGLSVLAMCQCAAKPIL